MNIQTLRGLRALVLSNAILLTVAAIPWIGVLAVNLGGLIAIFVLTLLISSKQKEIDLNRKPNYFAFAGVGLNVFSILLIITLIFQAINRAYTARSGASGHLAMDIKVVFYGLGFIVWCCYVIAMIMYWQNFNKLGKMIQEQEGNISIQDQQLSGNPYEEDRIIETNQLSSYNEDEGYQSNLENPFEDV